jgi:hypothetical protein
MKKIATFLFLTFVLTVNSQELTKTTEIYKHISGEYINSIETIKDNKVTDLKIHFLGRNHKYQHIDDLISFSYSSPNEFYKFLNKLIDCFKYEEGISLKVDGLNVRIDKMMGKKFISVRGKKDLGYRLFNEKKLKKILKKYESWCNKNNVNYKS